MEEWKIIKACDYCYNVTDGTHDSPKQKEVGKHLITSKHIKENRIDFENAYKISEEDYKKIISRSKVDQWDILISMIGAYCGFCCIESSTQTDYAIKNVGLFKIGDEIKCRWLYYYLTSPQGKEQLSILRSGSSQPYIPLGALRNLDIPVPSTQYMESTISILKSLDDKIELNRRINENLEQQTQALFKSWFVDFEPFKDGKFVDSELGMIPKGWKVVETNKVMRISKGSINPTKNPNRLYAHYSIPAFDEIGLPIFQYGNEIKSNKQIVLDNMTLVSKLNPRIKRVWFIDKACENAICSTEFIPYLSLNNSPYFLYCYLNSNIFYDSIMSSVNGATGSHQRFQANDTLKFLFPYNEEVICKFNSIVSGILIHKSRLINENMRLSQLRDTILPKLMSGELKINDFND